MILVLKTGSAINSIKSNYDDFEDWIASKMELSKSEYFVHTTGNYENLPPELNYSGIVITGSPLMVTNFKLNTSRVGDWLLDKQKNEVPILGICFGHQLLNVINGGSVKNNKAGIVIGTKTTNLTNAGKKDELLGALPTAFAVFKTHSQCVHELPESAEILSKDNIGIIDAIRFSAKSWGVQFHPEFSLNILKLYIKDKRESLLAQGFDIEELLNNSVGVDYGDKLLKRFKEITINAQQCK